MPLRAAKCEATAFSRDLRSPSIRDVDDSVIVRAKEHVLLSPVVAPNMGSNCYWKQHLISDTLLLLRRRWGPSKPEALYEHSIVQ